VTSSSSAARRPSCLAACALAVAACGSRTALESPRSECPQSEAIALLVAGATPGAHDVLLRFDPATGVSAMVGPIDCLGPGPPQPTVMAVDRAGEAYIATTSIDEMLLRVSTATASCSPSGFAPSYGGFGLAFTRSPGADQDTLYVVERGTQLDALDLGSLSLQPVGPLRRPAGSSPGGSGSGLPVLLTGTAAGDLYELDPQPLPPPPPIAPDGGRVAPSGPQQAARPWAVIWRVDVSTGSETAQWSVAVTSGVPPPQPQGFVQWGGDFLFFIAASAVTSEVWRFRPADGSFAHVADVAAAVLAAGASTCAPAP